MVVHPREKRFCWKIMILYGLNFDMHILLMYVLSFLFSIYCLGFWIYYVESCLLFISYATWILNDFDGLARLVNGCMRRWPTSFQRIKLHKSSMVRGESEFSRSFSSMTLWFARIFWFWTHCSNDLTNFENNIVA